MVMVSSSRGQRGRGAVSNSSDGGYRGAAAPPSCTAVLGVETLGGTCTDTPAEVATGLMKASGSALRVLIFYSSRKGGTDAGSSARYSRPSTATRESESPLREGRGTHELFRIR